MKILFDIIWCLGIATFLAFGFWGFTPLHRLKRLLIAFGLVASSLVSAAQGMIVFVGVFWMFPLGLYHGFLQLRGININTAQTPPEIIFLVGWIFYIIASGGYILVNNLTARRIVWGILILALLANIGGCQTMISSLKKI